MEKEVVTKALATKADIIFGTLEKELSRRFTGYAFVPENAKKEMKQAIQGALISGFQYAAEFAKGIENGKT